MGRYDKKYLRCDTTSVRDTKVGGKEYSVVLNEELANGVLVTLGKGFVPSAIAKNTMIKQASLPTASTSRLFLVFDPEINYKDDYQSDRQLGIHRIEANKPVAAVQLRNFDQITYSADYFTKDEGAGEIAVGDVFVQNEDGLLSYADGTTIKAEDYKVNFLVTKVDVSWKGIFYGVDGFEPASYKLITVEVEIAE